MLRQTTPVPNKLFDEQMKELSSVALRVYLKICRNTNGWRNENGEMKQRDWISHTQFAKVGVSSRSVTKAVEELLCMKMIFATDEYGNSLHDANKRKFANRIFYSLTSENISETNADIANNANATAKPRNRPPQNLHTTKDILQKSRTQNLRPDQRQTDKERLQEILDQEERKQYQQRDRWS